MNPVHVCTTPVKNKHPCRVSTLCFWCYKAGPMTIDHIISKPLYKFGRRRFQLDRRDYKVPSCRQCNENRAKISLAFQQLQRLPHILEIAFFKNRAVALPYIEEFLEYYKRLPSPLREACIYEAERLLG